MNRRCTYGPVPSRRFGLSLGVDLVPYKVCCYDCLYCQVGPTTNLTVERRDFIEPEKIAREVEEALHSGSRADCVTLSGSGEPTLYRGLDELVTALRKVTTLPLVLLTSGGLLWKEDVAEAVRRFDIVAPTLTSADPEIFARLNRPHREIDHARMLEGLRRFCQSFTGQLRLEVMLVRGVNDSPAALSQLATLVASLGAAQVDLNTPVRPPADPEAKPLSPDELEAARHVFEQSGCRATVIASPRREQGSAGAAADAPARHLVLETLSRRPCTLDDLSAALGIATETLSRTLVEASAAGEIEEEDREGLRYYKRRRR